MNKTDLRFLKEESKHNYYSESQKCHKYFFGDNINPSHGISNYDDIMIIVYDETEVKNKPMINLVIKYHGLKYAGFPSLSNVLNHYKNTDMYKDNLSLLEEDFEKLLKLYNVFLSKIRTEKIDKILKEI